MLKSDIFHAISIVARLTNKMYEFRPDSIGNGDDVFGRQLGCHKFLRRCLVWDVGQFYIIYLHNKQFCGNPASDPHFTNKE